MTATPRLLAQPKFQDPPKTGGRGLAPTIPVPLETVRALRMRPGEWALVATVGYSSMSHQWRKRFHRLGYTDIEVTTRRRPDGQIDAYVRSTGDIPDGTEIALCPTCRTYITQTGTHRCVAKVRSVS